MRMIDDRTSAAHAWQWLRHGESLLYQGDYHNARQLLSALGRRAVKHRPGQPTDTLGETFLSLRQAQSLAHNLLSRLLIPLEADYRIPLRRAPEVREMCTEVWGPADGSRQTVPLRELLGIIGATQWRRRGVEVPALGGRVYPHYGVFAPTRSEYLELIAGAPSPAGKRAFDLGTGTGVLALILVQRGATEVTATDCDPRAVACARENVLRYGWAGRIRVELIDLFPPERADLIVCNPPWIPALAYTDLDRAVYDPDHAFLRRFLTGLPQHLHPGGEAWLLLSNLAELLGLRPDPFFQELLTAAGLEIRWSQSRQPGHSRSTDPADPLHLARSQEIVTLYGLAVKNA